MSLIQEKQRSQGNLKDSGCRKLCRVAPGLGARMERDRMPAANGLLAYTAFKDRLVELDYSNRKLRVFTSGLTGPACPHDCRTLSTPRFSPGGPEVLAADGISIDGHPGL